MRNQQFVRSSGASGPRFERDLIADLLHSGELVRVLPAWITGRNTLYAALPSRKFIPARTSVFLEFLTDYTRRVIKKMESPPQ